MNQKIADTDKKRGVEILKAVDRKNQPVYFVSVNDYLCKNSRSVILKISPDLKDKSKKFVN
jgi:hypothetical protein